MFDHRISIEDKLRDLCLLYSSQSPLLPQFAKYKTEMTTISQHYVARAAQLEIITRPAPPSSQSGQRRLSSGCCWTLYIVSFVLYLVQFCPNYVSGLLLLVSPSVKLNDQRGSSCWLSLGWDYVLTISEHTRLYWSCLISTCSHRSCWHNPRPSK